MKVGIQARLKNGMNDESEFSYNSAPRKRRKGRRLLIAFAIGLVAYWWAK